MPFVDVLTQCPGLVDALEPEHLATLGQLATDFRRVCLDDSQWAARWSASARSYILGDTRRRSPKPRLDAKPAPWFAQL